MNTNILEPYQSQGDHKIVKCLENRNNSAKADINAMLTVTAL